MQTKTKICAAAVLLLVVICTVAGYHLSYPIKLEPSTLPEAIGDFYNRGNCMEVRNPRVVVYDRVKIEDKAWYLFEVGAELELGYVKLERGLNGRYRIDRLGYGGGNFREGIVEAGGRKYLLFGGRDATRRIRRVAAVIDGHTYELELLEAADHFLLCTEVDHHIENVHVGRENIILYDQAGADITESYDLSGGGIQ